MGIVLIIGYCLTVTIVLALCKAASSDRKYREQNENSDKLNS